MRWLTKALGWIWGDPMDSDKITGEAMRVLRRESVRRGLIRRPAESETLIERLEAEEEHWRRWLG